MLNVQRKDLPAVLRVLPALNSPTISPLSDECWVAVNTILEESVVRDSHPQAEGRRRHGHCRISAQQGGALMRVLEGSEAAGYVTGKLVSRGSAIAPKVERTVARIIRDVRADGDEALRKYARELDGLGENNLLLVSRRELESAQRQVSPRVHRRPSSKPRAISAALPSGKCQSRGYEPWSRASASGQRVEPLASVGCYVPGGRYPLPSSVLMTVIPAQVAGVRCIQVASPRPAPETLAAAAMLGVECFYRIGGAQAVAAFAYGTRSVPRVAKIVGPGNSYVTAAKKMVAFDCSIDMLAGPTEAIVFADYGNPEFFASDLVAQAEHDPETLPIFVTSNPRLAQEVAGAAMAMAAENPTARKSLAKMASRWSQPPWKRLSAGSMPSAPST